ncbi:MAG: FAD-containing monooxygenase EthA [Gammaproteobacteria bacterium RIFCSPHIGHO2_12_FULL_63_22]|nr:MAG: FAD-containing monooxygenase EthA [Gammaproteobacteria bacterium RIFCSPHIGHO2_12_FULL_63_22]
MIEEAGVVEHLDVLVVGAGLSGIAAAHHLLAECPGKSFAILESRAAIGGTWDLFRYPGVRSDSDIYTLGYSFKPWAGKETIADGDAILDYMKDVARAEGIDRRIRFGHRLASASWDSSTARWTVQVDRGESLPILALTCNFLFLCTGYYSYSEAHRPEFPGESDFGGSVVHPQFWPVGLDCRGKHIVVIGSGATAVTLVPALAAEAARVTMLQRSPSYVFDRPRVDRVVNALRTLLPGMAGYRLARLKFMVRDLVMYQLAVRLPALVKRVMLFRVRGALGSATQVAEHFTPRYPPWSQRVCLVPDGDLFASLRTGKSVMETGTIDRFTATGIRLHSGKELPADIIVTATGLKMEVMSGVALSVDGVPVQLGDTLVYKGCMISGVPNLALAFGYANASWTLKSELVCRHVCRVLKHMDRTGNPVCVPDARGVRATTDPLLQLSSNYIARALVYLPKQGDRLPWKALHNYALDTLLLRFGRLDDGSLMFSKPTSKGP